MGLKSKQIPIAALVTILLGAIGSATWELALKPVGSLILDGILKVVTLGMDSLRDDLYAQAALRQVDFSSNITLALLSAVLLTVASIPLLDPLLERWRKGKPKPFPMARLRYVAAESGSGTLERVDPSSEEIDEYLRAESAVKRKRQLQRWFVLLYAFGLVFFISVRTYYISTTVARFSQFAAIIAPHISEKERLQLDSAFASVKTRNDFVALIDDLQKKFAEAGLPAIQLDVF